MLRMAFLHSKAQPADDTDKWLKKLYKMENYAEAALRHWKDAELLEKENRVENADHLYGFAAECAIKKVLVGLPAFLISGTLEKTYKEHVNVLWGRAHCQNLQKSYPALFALLNSTNPFLHWKAHQRYAADGTITKVIMEPHKSSAMQLLKTANLIGVRKI